MTFTIHCTKRLLDWVKFLAGAAPSTSITYLGGWYATSLIWRSQLALFVHEETLLPVLMPLAPASSLAERQFFRRCLGQKILRNS